MPHDNDETKSPERPKLSVSDERVRAIRDRIWVARTRLEIAMAFTMWSEVREELRGIQSDLAIALGYIGR